MYLAKEVYDEDHSVYILTARNSIIKPAIEKFLHKFGIKAKDIICLDGSNDIASAKQAMLQIIIKSHEQTYFYDDDHRNIELARQLNCKVEKICLTNHV